jgi:hypothetical protein
MEGLAKALELTDGNITRFAEEFSRFAGWNIHRQQVQRWQRTGKMAESYRVLIERFIKHLETENGKKSK